MKCAAVVLAMLCLVAPAWAQDAGSPAGSEQQPAFGRPATSDSAPAARRGVGDVSVTPFFLTTGLVLLALVGALSLLKKVAAQKRWLASSEAIQVVGRRALGPNQSLLLVEVGSRILRVGLTKDSMVYLGETVDAEEVARIKGRSQADRPEPTAPTFQRALDASASELEGGKAEEPAPSRLTEVKRELASIRSAVLGWRKGTRDEAEEN